MIEKEYESSLTVAERTALGRFRDSLPNLYRLDDIVYEPSDPALFTKIRLFQVFPNLVESPRVEEPYNPKEHILELVTKLDNRFKDHPLRKDDKAKKNTYEIKDLPLPDGTTLNLKRKPYGKKIHFIVHHRYPPSTEYPYVENEKFSFIGEGNFNMEVIERYDQFRAPRSKIVATYSSYQKEFSKETKEALKYFRELIDPFLYENESE